MSQCGGRKKRLAEMATVNAAESLEKMLEKEAARKAAVTMLRDLLGMDRMPDRIECYDNSNLAGQDPVSAMVVFREGQPSKKDYRKFIIRDIDFQDDYAYMYQVLERRFKKEETELPHPDLLVVDGGKGQLGMAMAVLRDLGIEGRFSVAGLAKKNEAAGETEDKIYLPGRSNPLNTAQVPKALYLLQQVRDEAHRFCHLLPEKAPGKTGRGLCAGRDSRHRAPKEKNTPEPFQGDLRAEGRVH